MAVYRKNYHGYSALTTSLSLRFLVVARYALRRILQSRILVAFLAAGALYTAGCAVYVYACNNLQILDLVGVRAAAAQTTLVGSGFFSLVVKIGGGLAFLLAALSGPDLVAPDLANQGIVLYLSRPFSRAEYLLGKWSVLALLLSVVTWIPGSVLFMLQAALAGGGWGASHLWILGAIFLGSLYGIMLLSLLALTFSAWFRRKLAAGGAMFLVFFLGGGFAQAFNASLHTHGADILNLGQLISTVEDDLFRQRVAPGITPGAAWFELLVICALCLMVIVRKIRPCEVVRG
ncbi:MAG TPA: ABC transporter permease [Terriglobia bacterium]|nr:ABC transporter permease [Terriglobia bacterium]